MAKPKATHCTVFIIAQIHSHAIADMLRYDKCCPATEVESRKLERSLGSNENNWIILQKFYPLGGKIEPSVDRWKSFGTTCIPQYFTEYHDAEEFLALLEAKKTA